ncbi:MAG TPA: ADOP family duplicated permease [Gemmatimonadaceae bacterium]|nr:ADOP family duplicated permease [Gemmatimonadaceae bacterium]
MRPISMVRHIWRTVAHRRRAELDLDEELHAYVALLAAEHQRAGAGPEAARRAALLATGGIERVKDETRDAWVGESISNAVRAVRHALRSLARSPVYTSTAILTLAIGIGGATAMITIFKGTLLRPLPAVRAPAQLVSVEVVASSGALGEMSYPDFRDIRGETHTLSGLTAYNGTPMQVHDAAGDTRAMVNYVSGEFFSVLGVRAAAGRLLAPSDVVPRTIAPVVVISYRFWQQRFGRAVSAVGSTLDVYGYPLTIIGVAPKGFIGAMNLYPMDLWIPLTMLQPVSNEGDPTARRGDGWFRAVGRLAPGHTVAEAQRELSLIMSRLAATYAEDRGRGVRVFAGAGMASYDRSDVERLPRLVSAAVAMVLLIACANVANLGLVRSAARRRELATRLALGASRTSLAGRLAIEGAILAVAAAALGVGLAQLVVWAPVVHTIVAMPNPDLSLDWRVVFAAALLALGVAVLVSLAPVAHAMHLSPGAVLKDGAAGAVRRRSRLQRLLVAGQVAASLVLLGAAAAVFDAMQHMLAADPGFDVPGVTYAWIDPHTARLDSAGQLAFFRELLANVRRNASVAAAALTTTPPPQEWSTRASVFRAGEEPSREQLAGHDFDFPIRSYMDNVSPALFAVLHIPLLRGREFTSADDEHAAHVVIVSRRLGEALWPGVNPIGKLLVWPNLSGAPRPPLLVVGEVADTKHASLADAEPPFVMYVPYTQERPTNLSLLVRTRDGAPVSAAWIRRIVAGIAPSARVEEPRPLGSVIAMTLEPQRLASLWIGAFGSLALVLAAVGLYGVVAQGVLQRRRELAVRTALGARPRAIAWLVIGEGLSLGAGGAGAGLAASVLAMRLVRAELEGVGAFDARAIAVAAALLTAMVLLACWIPARRAARLDPMAALRVD